MQNEINEKEGLGHFVEDTRLWLSCLSYLISMVSIIVFLGLSFMLDTPIFAEKIDTGIQIFSPTLNLKQLDYL